MFNDLHSAFREFICTFQNADATLNIFKIVAKTSEKVLRLNMTSGYKLKSHVTKQRSTLISIDILKNLSTLKMRPH